MPVTRHTTAAAAGALLLAGLASTDAEAGDIIDTLQQSGEFTILVQAIEEQPLAATLRRGGLFTVFAPTDAAFERLPSELRDRLLAGGEAGAAEMLVQNHVVEGMPIPVRNFVGKETDLASLAGDRLKVDGRSGSLTVQGAASTEETAAETDVTEDGMPATAHQQEVLQGEVATEQRQTAPEGGMPATGHQQAVLAGLSATPAKVTEADIPADNGTIHVIDAVLMPQQMLSMLQNEASPAQ
jgi:uncharacterized surface protein with fasciclin (FAS1) repeats